MFKYRLLFAVSLGAFALSFVAYTEYATFRSTKEEPTTITMADLVANGYGDNAHVILTEFAFSDYAAISEGDHDKSAFFPATTVLDAVTAVMEGAKTDPVSNELVVDENFNYIPKTFPLVVCLKDTTDSEIEAFWNTETIQGIVLTGFRSLGSDTRSELKKQYPLADFSNMMALHVNKERPSLNFIIGLASGGVICLLILLFSIMRTLIKRREAAATSADGFEHPTPMN